MCRRCHFIDCVQEKKPENAFREVVSTRKMMYFSGSIFFKRFEKHPKDFAGALWVHFQAQEVFGSFEKHMPGLKHNMW